LSTCKAGVQKMNDTDWDNFMARLKALPPLNNELIEAAKAVIDRWDSTDWERNTAEENVRLVGVIARKNGAEELAEAKGRREALHVLTSLKTGGCFCAIGIGHPGMTSHSPQCIAATTVSESARAQQEKTK